MKSWRCSRATWEVNEDRRRFSRRRWKACDQRRMMILYFSGIFRREAGTLGAREISSR